MCQAVVSFFGFCLAVCFLAVPADCFTIHLTSGQTISGELRDGDSASLHYVVKTPTLNRLAIPRESVTTSDRQILDTILSELAHYKAQLKPVEALVLEWPFHLSVTAEKMHLNVAPESLANDGVLAQSVSHESILVSPRDSFAIGLMAEHAFNSVMAISSGVRYVLHQFQAESEGWRFGRTYPFIKSYQLQYLSAPFILQYSPVPHVLDLQLGLAMDMLLLSVGTIQIGTISSDSYDLAANCHRVHYTGSFGAQWQWNDWRFYLRYDQALSPVFTHSQALQSAFVLGTGFRFLY